MECIGSPWSTASVVTVTPPSWRTTTNALPNAGAKFVRYATADGADAFPNTQSASSPSRAISPRTAARRRSYSASLNAGTRYGRRASKSKGIRAIPATPPRRVRVDPHLRSRVQVTREKRQHHRCPDVRRVDPDAVCLQVRRAERRKHVPLAHPAVCAAALGQNVRRPEIEVVPRLQQLHRTPNHLHMLPQDLAQFRNRSPGHGRGAEGHARTNGGITGGGQERVDPAVGCAHHRGAAGIDVRLAAHEPQRGEHIVRFRKQAGADLCAVLRRTHGRRHVVEAGRSGGTAVTPSPRDEHQIPRVRERPRDARMAILLQAAAVVDDQGWMRPPSGGPVAVGDQLAARARHAESLPRMQRRSYGRVRAGIRPYHARYGQPDSVSAPRGVISTVSSTQAVPKFRRISIGSNANVWPGSSTAVLIGRSDGCSNNEHPRPCPNPLGM